MEINEYQRLAMTTLNKELNKKEVLINAVMGLCGESGEAVDLVKKHLFQGHELDKEHLAKELGDVAWYLAEAAYALDMDLNTILENNILKLKKRFPEGFKSFPPVNKKQSHNFNNSSISKLIGKIIGVKPTLSTYSRYLVFTNCFSIPSS